MTGRTRWQALVAAAAAAAACAVTAACGGSGLPASSAASPARPAASAASSSAGSPAATGSGRPPAAPAATGTPHTACVTQVLGKLSLAQRVGQLFLVAVDGNSTGSGLSAAEHTYHFGSVLLNKSGIGTEALAGQTGAIQALAASGTGGVGFFIAANQEGGAVQQLTGSGFAPIPSELTQGSWSSAALRAAATGWGTDLRAAGVNLDLAPVMDVVPAESAASNAPIGALDREYGADPAVNAAHGAAFIKGMAAAGIMTVAKHFPGLGRVTGNTDFTAGVVDNVTTADDPDLDSFRGAVGAGVPMVMVALATYAKIDPSQLAVFSPAVIRLLRDGLGFSGVIISDDLGQAEAVRSVPAGIRAVRFLTAGGDLVTSQSLGPAEQMAAAVLAKASGNAAFRATVDAAAQQVLAAKKAAGLLSC
jgi:beta-N-acetylhexosaminidase